MGLIRLDNYLVLMAYFISQEKWVQGIYLKPTYLDGEQAHTDTLQYCTIRHAPMLILSHLLL